jgi:hypothetical protein
VVTNVGLVLFELIQAASQLIATQDEVMNGLMKSLGQMK